MSVRGFHLFTDSVRFACSFFLRRPHRVNLIQNTRRLLTRERLAYRFVQSVGFKSQMPLEEGLKT